MIEIICAIDHDEGTALVMFDLSAAFDTVDDYKLLNVFIVNLRWKVYHC